MKNWKAETHRTEHSLLTNASLYKIESYIKEQETAFPRIIDQISL